MGAEPLLAIDDLHVALPDGRRLLDGVSLGLTRGEALGVVGESGSGKSLTAMSVMGLLQGMQTQGAIRLDGRSLLGQKERDWRALRGREVAMIFQDPMTAFLPVRRIGAQIDEQIRLHEKLSRRAARARTVQLLGDMGVPDPRRRPSAFRISFRAVCASVR